MISSLKVNADEIKQDNIMNDKYICLDEQYP